MPPQADKHGSDATVTAKCADSDSLAPLKGAITSEQIPFRENCWRRRGSPCGCIAADLDHLVVPSAMALGRHRGTANSIFRQRRTHCGGVRSTRPKLFHGNWQVLCTCQTLARPLNSCLSLSFYANV